MKSKALSNEEKLLLRKQSDIETVNDELKIFVRQNTPSTALLVASCYTS